MSLTCFQFVGFKILCIAITSHLIIMLFKFYIPLFIFLLIHQISERWHFLLKLFCWFFFKNLSLINKFQIYFFKYIKFPDCFDFLVDDNFLLNWNSTLSFNTFYLSNLVNICFLFYSIHLKYLWNCFCCLWWWCWWWWYVYLRLFFSILVPSAFYPLGISYYFWNVNGTIFKYPFIFR